MHFNAVVFLFFLSFFRSSSLSVLFFIMCTVMYGETDNIVCLRSIKGTRCAVTSGNAHQEHTLVTVNTPETTVKMKLWF